MCVWGVYGGWGSQVAAASVWLVCIVFDLYRTKRPSLCLSFNIIVLIVFLTGVSVGKKRLRQLISLDI